MIFHSHPNDYYQRHRRSRPPTVMTTETTTTTTTTTAAALSAETTTVMPIPVPVLLDRAHSQATTGNYEAARESFQQAVTQLHVQRQQEAAVAATTPGVVATLKSIHGDELAVVLANLGHCCAKLGNMAEAAEHWQEALRLKRCYYNYEATAAGGAEQSNKNLDLASALEDVGKALKALGDYIGAKNHYQEALDIKQIFYGKQESNTASPALTPLPPTGDFTGEAKTPLGDPPQRPLRRLKRQAYGYDRAKNTDVAYTLVKLAEIAHCLGRYHKSRLRYTEALDMYQVAYSTADLHYHRGGTHRSLPMTCESVQHVDIAKVLAQLGHVNADIGKHRHAATYFQQAVHMVDALAAAADDDAEASRSCAEALVQIHALRQTCLLAAQQQQQQQQQLKQQPFDDVSEPPSSTTSMTEDEEN